MITTMTTLQEVVPQLLVLSLPHQLRRFLTTCRNQKYGDVTLAEWLALKRYGGFLVDRQGQFVGRLPRHVGVKSLLLLQNALRDLLSSQESMQTKPLLTLRSHHGPACGAQPVWQEQCPPGYVGYFENKHGEQFVFSYERATREGWLWSGEAQWQRYPVRDGTCQHLLLEPSEQQWLQTCWYAATWDAAVALREIRQQLDREAGE